MHINTQAIQQKLKDIHSLKNEYEYRLGALRKELISLAEGFDSYAEAYCFVKSITHSQEEFNTAMWDIRELFLDKLIEG